MKMFLCFLRKSLFPFFLTFLIFTNTCYGQTGLQFNGTNQYVTSGVTPTNSILNTPTFTVEAWFKRNGTGVSVSTGSGGISAAIPLVSKGTSQAENAAADINYFLGINTAGNVLCADFEEGTGQASPSLNHPVSGTTAIVNGIWYHAAATYDGTNLKLYLNGSLEADLFLGSNHNPNAALTSPFAIASSIQNTPSAQGFFNGLIDEARIWNYARTQAQISASMNSELTSGTGLLGRWGLNDGTGTTAVNSIAGSPNGTLTNGPTWACGAPAFDVAPAAPTGLTTSAPSAMQINLGWTDNSNNEAGFEIERSTTGIAGTYTLLATVNANVTSYSDLTVYASNEYCYRVRSKNCSFNSAYTSSSCITPAEGTCALDLGSAGAYVTFGQAMGLATQNFTVEIWFKRTGTGTANTTGSGGINIIPLLTKGSPEADGSNVDANYILGIQSGTNVIAADFEEGTGSTTPGLNHPLTGTTIVTDNVWHHAAATFENGVFNIYLDGILQNTSNLGTLVFPQGASIQHAALGTMITSTGTAAGKFQGIIDEARIWNYARTQLEIQTSINSQITTSQSGLLGRWGLNEGTGTIVHGNAGTSFNGNITGTGSTWACPGAPFNLAINFSPDQPINPSPVNNGPAPSTSPNICATVSDLNGGNLTVRFYGRKKPVAGAKLTIIGLPDTQFYTEEPQGQNSGGGGHNGIFKAQTQWIADHQVDSNIAFVVQLGDCTQNGDLNQIEWKRADTSMKNIENPNVPLTDGIPYGICVGNHDQGPNGNGDPNGTTTYYNQYFGTSRFTGRAYYGGHYGSNNDNHYELFSGGGVDFIHISIEYYPDGTTSPLQSVLDWADALLKAYPNRKGIISTHNMLGTGNPGNFQGPGQKIYDDLKDNPNLILMLAGHVAGEGRRTDVFSGNTVHTLMADYQSGYTNGGNGYLRIMQFLPAQNLLSVKTYSPYSNTSFTGSSSQFTLPVSLTQSFSLIGTNTSVSSGSQTCINWPSLDQFTDYEWYVEIFDGVNTTTGPVWTFTTPANSPLPVSLINFTAKAENNEKVKISWTTTYERNNSHFEVQRSKDGITYNTIAIVPGNNNSNTLHDYSLYDNQPHKGVSFYRLKQVDNDQQFSYSGIARVNISDAINGIEIYPNPSSGNSFMVGLKDNIPGLVTIKIYDITGRLQMQQQFTNTQNIAVNHHLSPGIYMINVVAEGLNENRKLIIE